MSVLVVTGLALAGCSSPPPAGATLSTAPAGYVQDTAASTGHLSLSAAAQSTPADPALAARQLHASRFVSAAAKVWHTPADDFVLDVVFRFRSEQGAMAFKEFVLQQVAARTSSTPGPSSGVFAYPGVPGAKAYLVAGPKRVGTGPIFIQGVVFTVGPRAYMVETGGPMPGSLDQAELLAREQYSIATTTGGAP